jgi:hypothetical protein
MSSIRPLAVPSVRVISQCERGVVPCGGAVALERGVDEGLEPVADVVTVHLGDHLAGEQKYSSGRPA